VIHSLAVWVWDLATIVAGLALTVWLGSIGVAILQELFKKGGKGE
jgi:hypothetical protein